MFLGDWKDVLPVTGNICCKKSFEAITESPPNGNEFPLINCRARLKYSYIYAI